MLNIVPMAAEVGRHITLLTVWASRLRLIAGIDTFRNAPASTGTRNPSRFGSLHSVHRCESRPALPRRLPCLQPPVRRSLGRSSGSPASPTRPAPAVSSPLLTSGLPVHRLASPLRSTREQLADQLPSSIRHITGILNRRFHAVALSGSWYQRCVAEAVSFLFRKSQHTFLW